MKNKIFTPEELLTPRVKNVRDKLLRGFGLTKKYLMSTSGKNYVLQCFDKNKKRYLLKIRRVNTLQNKKEFTKEASIYKFFEKKKAANPQFPRNVFTNTNKEKQFIIYDYIGGIEAGTYFFIYPRTKRYLNPKSITDALDFLQKNTNLIKKKTTLEKLDKKFYQDFIRTYQSSGKKFLGKKLYQGGLEIIKKNFSLLTKNLVLAHGDFNAKNIILPIINRRVSKNKIAVIDWSDAALANPAWDQAFIYLVSWNYKRALDYLKIDQKIFDVDCLVLIPKLLNVTSNYIKAINYEYRAGMHKARMKKKFIEEATQAQGYYKNLYKEIIQKYK